MNEQHFVHRGRRLYYRDIGEGPSVVLLHGFPFDGRIWFPFAERLSTSFRLIIPDLAGFGSSDVPAEQLSMELMAGDVAALVSYLNIDRHVVVGHSMGGYVALAMAAGKMTNKLSGLVLFHSQAAADDEAGRARRNDSIALIRQDKAAFVHGFVPGLYGKSIPSEADEHLTIAMSQSSEAMASAMAGLRDRKSHTDWLNNAEIPILFVVGKQDSRMPHERIMAQAALLPHAEVLVLEGIAHMGFAEAPDIIAPVIRDFCQRCL